MDKSIFRVYDIRGKYGEDFDAEFSQKLAGVFVEYLDSKTLVVSHDTRPSSKEITSCVVRGASSAGCNVINLGQTSTPLFYFGVINEKADGGIMVTASHLGEEFNGFKLTGKEAIAVGGEDLLRSTEGLFKKPVKKSKNEGNVLKKDILADYADSVIRHSGIKPGDIKTKVKLIGNDTVVGEARTILEKISVPIVEKGEDIALEFDADGDRLVVVNKKGDRMRGDLIGGLLAGYYYPNQKIVYDLRYSRGVLEYMQFRGIELVPSRAGRTLIKKVMRDNEIPFCAENTGHMFFKETGYTESPVLAAIKVLNILEETGKNIDDLTRNISSWSTTDEINFTLTNTEEGEEIIKKIKNSYSDANINEMDGLHVEYPDWGFLLRQSNTEAKLRLIVDAKTEELLKEEKEKVLRLLGEAK